MTLASTSRLRRGGKRRHVRSWELTVTFSDLYPPPVGVVMGALRKTFVLRRMSQLSGAIPLEWPRLYICSPMSMNSGFTFAPAAFRMDNVASMISGPAVCGVRGTSPGSEGARKGDDMTLAVWTCAPLRRRGLDTHQFHRRVRPRSTPASWKLSASLGFLSRLGGEGNGAPRM